MLAEHRSCHVNACKWARSGLPPKPLHPQHARKSQGLLIKAGRTKDNGYVYTPWAEVTLLAHMFARSSSSEQTQTERTALECTRSSHLHRENAARRQPTSCLLALAAAAIGIYGSGQRRAAPPRHRQARPSRPALVRRV